ncbi:MAG: helix-turn-helix transcriptional regulator [Anaerolineae bacterium]|nr:helix-turn-helix transcriptional regulator [Anaerolineae bacterium]
MDDGYDRLAAIAKALGHPTRLKILEVLSQEEACVCHLEAVLGQRQAYISQQLIRLREAGLVIDRRDGSNVFYALADDSIEPLLEQVKQTALAIAAQTGDPLVFDVPDHGCECACTCPRCEAEKIRGV